MRVLTYRGLTIVGLLAICVLIVVASRFREPATSWLMPNANDPWAEFKVPVDATQLHATVHRARGGVEICNQGTRKWSEVVIRLNDKYLAKQKAVGAGECRYVPMADFADPLKGVLHPRNESAVKVEVLADYHDTGYVLVKPE